MGEEALGESCLVFVPLLPHYTSLYMDYYDYLMWQCVVWTGGHASKHSMALQSRGTHLELHVRLGGLDKTCDLPAL